MSGLSESETLGERLRLQAELSAMAEQLAAAHASIGRPEARITEAEQTAAEVADLRKAVSRLQTGVEELGRQPSNHASGRLDAVDASLATMRSLVERVRCRVGRADRTDRPALDHERLAARFDELGPWWTQFVIDGRSYGGATSFADDRRVPTFFEWAGTWPRILELGSLEGAHTFQLAAHPGVEKVVGIEGREANIHRAQFVLELLPNPKISFHHVDVAAEDSRMEEFLPVDAVLCAGVLYHLPEPWRLLRRLAAGTPRVFLDTHYAAVAETEVNGYRGRWFQEGGLADPLSGLSERSFWPTVDELVRMCADCGFSVHQRRDFSDWAGAGPRTWMYLERTR